MRNSRGQFVKGHKGYGGGVKKGFEHTEATKLKMSKTRKGRPHSQAHKESIRKALKGKINLGENNFNWKGDEAGQRALHEWLTNHYPKPGECQQCGIEEVKLQNRGLELANITGKYTRNIKDYKWLCPCCHRKLDGQTEKIIEAGKATRFKKEV